MLQSFDISNLDYLIQKINSLKYLKSTLGCTDIEILKLECVVKTQFRYLILETNPDQTENNRQ